GRDSTVRSQPPHEAWFEIVSVRSLVFGVVRSSTATPPKSSEELDSDELGMPIVPVTGRLTVGRRTSLLSITSVPVRVPPFVRVGGETWTVWFTWSSGCTICGTAEPGCTEKLASLPAPMLTPLIT